MKTNEVKACVTRQLRRLQVLPEPQRRAELAELRRGVTNRQPRCPAAYSMLPSWWSSMMLPASRMTNSSPMPAEKMFSGMTRESEQVTMMA